MTADHEASRQALLADPALAASGVPRHFSEIFFRHVPDLAHRPPAILAAAAAGIWRLAARRAPGQTLVALDGRAVRVITDDMRFLVDSTLAALTDLGLAIDLVIHPVVAVERDTAGSIVALESLGARPESMIHVTLAADVAPPRQEAVVTRLAAVLDEVRAVVTDFPAMRRQVAELAAGIRAAPGAPEQNGEEDAALLDWLGQDNFVFLGTRHYRMDGVELAVVAHEGLGLLRAEDFLVFDGLRALTRASPDVQAFLHDPNFTMISKSNRRAPVHRPVPMDTILVKLFDADRRVIGLRLVLGLFSTDSASRLPHEIPVLRQKVARCQQRSGLAPDGRDRRALQHVLDTFPRDTLFQIDETQLFETAMGVLHLRQRPALAVFMLRDPFERFSTFLVYLPRDRFTAEIARRIAGILEQEVDGKITFETTQFEDAALARLHFVIGTPPGQARIVSVPDIERRLTEALRSWADRLAEAMDPAPDGAQRMRTFAPAFPPAYVERFSIEMAVADIAQIEAVLAGAAIGVTTTIVPHPGADTMRLRLTHAHAPVPLSDVLPTLENLGVRVISEIPFEITPRDGPTVWLQELELEPLPQQDLTPADTDRFEAAFRAVWAGEVEDDGFNRLVLQAGLHVRDAIILRTYAKLLRQAGSLFSQATMARAMSTHPRLAAALVRLFAQRFDPMLPRSGDAEAQILEGLAAVDNLDEDRILRSLLLLIGKTLRTNHYQPDAAGRPKPYLSLKLASREIDLLPQPRPVVEIFVASPRMEGCHLRGGRVARGGIRWSDRAQDFRTEVLGLMKAQMVKNAVIVPIGSKGGFVVRRMPDGDRETVMAEVIACYRTLMCGLLDLTDNIVGNEVVPPPHVVRHDGDDTYLVVAADKGTATFSDIANAVAIEYGFWLGDAFASGGSVGYDHKVMGITAKGAWEAVKRHFREIGTDIQTAPFTCVGVGDMSGDVFGNAMMLSRHTRLIAAFNHQHIFLDPDPDPTASFAERVRLFALPRSSWRDYDATVLSKGGGIHDRRAKSLTLSPEVCARLRLPPAPITPNELIQALLRQDVDLLWFGGIGTYVKASFETDADAGDRANDALRVDAPSLRARVIGEGANLAVTQRARIQFALAGGRINTDAIDNSAGVDTSDHEVNIKIATGDVILAGLVTPADRSAFLAAMTADVEAHVLIDNILQTQALTVAEHSAPGLLDSHAGLMRSLERAGRLDRKVEFLPDDEALAARAAAGRGLTRPEIAVLMAYVKNGLKESLLATDLADLPDLRPELLAYFPNVLRALAPDVLVRHRLHREIITTSVANFVINRMGPGFVHDTQARTGRDVGAIAQATLIVRDVFGLTRLWAEIAALDNQVPAAVQTRLSLAAAVIVDQAARWFLQSGLELLPGATTESFRPGLEQLAAQLPTLLPEPERLVNEARMAEHVAAGVPTALAARIVTLNTLSTAMDIIEVARRHNAEIATVAQIYFAAGVDLGLLLLRRRARLMPTTNHWQRLAADALADDSYLQQREVTNRQAQSGAAVHPSVALQEVLADIARTMPPDLAMLTVASRRVRGLLQ